ncbi:hypothetical protein ACLB2K_021924 [Fragaria x ananassa]
MASSKRRKGNSLAIQEKTPGFFKVVLNKALQDGKLEIKGFVASKYRDFLANSVILKDPNGAKWPVKLTRSDGSTWLEKGWLKFAHFYSLEEGYFLFFSYECVDSCFHVRIFSKNYIEINYPFKSSQHEEPNLGGGDGVKFSSADSFKSTFPFCVIKVQPTYVKYYHLQIPISYAKNFICRGQTRNVDLRIPKGKTWSAKSSVTKQAGRSEIARIHGGWSKFAKDNHLRVGDDIVLEMIKQQPKITFEVHIFRA